MQPKQAQLHAEIERLALTDLLESAMTFYQDPVNQQAFEVWKNSKEAQEYANLINSRTDTGKP